MLSSKLFPWQKNKKKKTIYNKKKKRRAYSGIKI